jgi:hypothetical protein
LAKRNNNDVQQAVRHTLSSTDEVLKKSILSLSLPALSRAYKLNPEYILHQYKVKLPKQGEKHQLAQLQYIERGLMPRPHPSPTPG